MLPRNERKVAESFTASLAPMLVKYLEKLSAMSMGSVIVLPSDLNDEGRGGLFSRFSVPSFSSFHVVLILFLASSSLES